MFMQWEFLHWLPDTRHWFRIAELKRLGREDILVFAGGVIPAQDYDFLYKAGVMAIFGPGTSVAKSACQVMELLLEAEEE